MKSYFTNKRAEVAEFLPPSLDSLRVLEIGCGAGVFRSNFASVGEYWGVEVNPQAADQAAGLIDKVLEGTYRDVCDQLPEEYFDCVICADVIEHMDDEIWFLQHIKTKMRKNGILVGSIPNVRYVSNLVRLLIQKDWRYVDAGILDRTHLRFFTCKSLLRTFRETRWKIDEFRGINPISIDSSSFVKFFISLGLVALTFFVGRDSRCFQFGFRIRLQQD
jgi:2-polyprenyl-3-methyl-5-hydroxy-6-metoxy-1,4-benzoquinol methylase